MPADLKAFLDLHLVSLAGSVITPGSILVAATVLFSTFVLASLLARSTRKLLAAREVREGVQFAASKMIRYATLLIGAATAFSSMGFKLDALLAASAVLAVGIGFGLQNVTQNFVSGVILLVEQPVRHGDFVKVGETLGRVDDIGLRATRIVTRDEVTIIVPNSRLISDEVVNHSRPTNQLRMKVSLGVAYGSDTRRVREVLLRVARAHETILETPSPEVRFDDFGDSALKFSLLVWIGDPRADLRVGSELRYAIDAAFRDEALEMPFPQLDLHASAPCRARRPPSARRERGDQSPEPTMPSRSSQRRTRTSRRDVPRASRPPHHRRRAWAPSTPRPGWRRCRPRDPDGWEWRCLAVCWRDSAWFLSGFRVAGPGGG